MSALTTVQIRVDERFQHLPRAPIVEAVIDLRARAAEKLEEQTCRSVLEPQLQGYHFADSRRHYRAETKVEEDQPPRQSVQDLGWKGLRFRSEDQRQIVQFNRDGFVFSRLEPYENWEQLQAEALRLWATYKALAKPVEIQRIGLRFVNRIQMPANDLEFENYICPTPKPPETLDLPFHGFLHQDTLAVPGHPYAIKVVRTIQPPAQSDGHLAVILDIDVFTNQAFEMNDELLRARLAEMRWLKNKVFFGSITRRALEGFK